MMLAIQSIGSFQQPCKNAAVVAINTSGNVGLVSSSAYTFSKPISQLRILFLKKKCWELLFHKGL